ncbi:MAG: Gfo/Idh/MocA family protein [Brevundimonas sp.]|uniref:Gfo/Idh/MocA family protein n=1 Tax=Brevundimonas sp. TaxID=1871086 RepID=UPI00391DD5A4
MHVLLIGFSSIGARRVIPALADMDGITSIDIASVSKASPQTWPKRGEWFGDYAHALSASRADLVYVSLPNAYHERWVLEALGSGRHVIVDKPAVTSLSGARRCVELARSRSALLAEATVFGFHPQIQALKILLRDIGPLTHLDALFIIPPLPLDNFRNSASSGGGCLLDMGPYAAAVARLFGDELATLCAFPAPSSQEQVDVGFSLAARFRSGLRYTGHFSFESEYQNRLTLVGRHGSVVVDRVFSPPAESPLLWQVRRQNQAVEIVQPAGDMFRVFLEAALGAIRDRNLDEFASTLLKDAAFRDRVERELHYGHTYD